MTAVVVTGRKVWDPPPIDLLVVFGTYWGDAAAHRSLPPGAESDHHRVADRWAAAGRGAAPVYHPGRGPVPPTTTTYSVNCFNLATTPRCGRLLWRGVCRHSAAAVTGRRRHPPPQGSPAGRSPGTNAGGPAHGRACMSSRRAPPGLRAPPPVTPGRRRLARRQRCGRGARTVASRGRGATPAPYSSNAPTTPWWPGVRDASRWRLSEAPAITLTATASTHGSRPGTEGAKHDGETREAGNEPPTTNVVGTWTQHPVARRFSFGTAGVPLRVGARCRLAPAPPTNVVLVGRRQERPR